MMLRESGLRGLLLRGFFFCSNLCQRASLGLGDGGVEDDGNDAGDDGIDHGGSVAAASGLDERRADLRADEGADDHVAEHADAEDAAGILGAIGLLNGDRVADIADGLGVTTATVYRELKRGETGGLDRNLRKEYNPVLAQQRVQENFKRRGKSAGNS